MSLRSPLPAVVRWSAVVLVVPVTVVATFLSVFAFGSRCPSAGGPGSEPGALPGHLCAQATGATNPGDVVITLVSLLAGAFLVSLLLRADRWRSLLLVGASCVATPVALVVVLATAVAPPA
jgi:hypothetical protein